MPSSALPPEEQPKVKRFDPLVLDRTVISVPAEKHAQFKFIYQRMRCTKDIAFRAGCSKHTEPGCGM